MSDPSSDSISVDIILEKCNRHIALFENDPKSAIESRTVEKSNEHLLAAKAEVPISKVPWLQEIKDEEIEFMLILDKSGSMGGTPWKQVQTAVIKIIEIIQPNKKIHFQVMVYNNKAEKLKLSKDPKAANMEIKKIRAGGSTNFVATFDLIGEEFESSKISKWLTRSRKGILMKKAIFFLTDGCDTCNDARAIADSKERLQTKIQGFGREVVFHAIGFGGHHDENFLEGLTLLGTSDGSYSYIGENEGEDALERKLVKLLESASGLVGKSVYLELKMVGDGNKFLGDWFGQTDKEAIVQAFMAVEEFKNGTLIAKVETSQFVLLTDEENLDLKVSMLRELKDEDSEVTQCHVNEIIRRLPGDDTDVSDRLTLRKLRTALNMLTGKLVASADDGGDVDAVIKANKPWHDSLVAVYDKFKEEAHGKTDEDVKKLTAAVENGLKICDEIVNPAPAVAKSASLFSKQVKSSNMDWNLVSSQMHNVMQVNKSTTRTASAAGRSERQSKQKRMA